MWHIIPAQANRHLSAHSPSHTSSTRSALVKKKSNLIQKRSYPFQKTLDFFQPPTPRTHKGTPHHKIQCAFYCSTATPALNPNKHRGSDNGSNSGRSMTASATKNLTATPTTITHHTDPQRIKHKSGNKTAKTTIKNHLSTLYVHRSSFTSECSSFKLNHRTVSVNFKLLSINYLKFYRI